MTLPRTVLQAQRDMFSTAQSRLLDCMQSGRAGDARVWTRMLVFYARLLNPGSGV